MAKARLTVVTATRPATLGKRFALKPDGTLDKTTAGELVQGLYTVKEFQTVEDLAALLESVGADQAIMASLPKDGSAAGKLVVKDKRRGHPGALARTKDCFGFPEKQAGALVLDYDPPPGQVPMTQAWLWGCSAVRCQESRKRVCSGGAAAVPSSTTASAKFKDSGDSGSTSSSRTWAIQRASVRCWRQGFGLPGMVEFKFPPPAKNCCGMSSMTQWRNRQGWISAAVPCANRRWNNGVVLRWSCPMVVFWTPGPPCPT